MAAAFPGKSVRPHGCVEALFLRWGNELATVLPSGKTLTTKECVSGARLGPTVALDQSRCLTEPDSRCAQVMNVAVSHDHFPRMLVLQKPATRRCDFQVFERGPVSPHQVDSGGKTAKREVM